jgi:hypothetical protein
VLNRNGVRLLTEYIVDAAAAEANPLRRIAFVAAFAMSNYSSTIGRIAKPFNPMLVRERQPTTIGYAHPAVERNVRIRPPR